MDFDINLYTPTDPNKVPAGFKSREEEAFRDCAGAIVFKMPAFQAESTSAMRITRNIVELVRDRRPNGYFYIKLSKSTETEQDEGYKDFYALLSNVFARHPLFPVISDFEEAQTAQGFADQVTETSSASEAANNSSTTEKYNPINSEYSKLGGRVEGKLDATATNAETTTTKKTGDEVERILKEFRPIVVDIVNEICSVYVYSADEIAEAYYLDNADECED